MQQFSETFGQPNQYYGGNKLIRRDFSDSEDEEKKPDFSCYKNNNENIKPAKSNKSQSNSKKQKISLQDLNKLLSNKNKWEEEVDIVSDSNSKNSKSTSPIRPKEQEINYQEDDKIITAFTEDLLTDNEEEESKEYNSVQEVFKEIINLRQQNRSQKKKIIDSSHENKLLTIAKKMYNKSIQQQFSIKHSVDFDLHYLTKDNVIEMVNHCTEQIIQYCQDYDRKLKKINVNFITGNGNNSELYHKVRRHLQSNKDLYHFTKDQYSGNHNVLIVF